METHRSGPQGATPGTHLVVRRNEGSEETLVVQLGHSTAPNVESLAVVHVGWKRGNDCTESARTCGSNGRMGIAVRSF
jgi:hypothetical protein